MKKETKLIGYKIISSRAGDPMIRCDFDCGESWFGSFKEGKAREITINTIRGTLATDFTKMLLKSDPFKISDVLSDISEKQEKSGYLDIEKTYSVEVVEEEYEGKKRTRIQWVNDVNSGSKGHAFNKSVFSSMNLASNVAEYNNKNPNEKIATDFLK